ncbi:MAG: carbon-nitrogen hydrolase family protein [Clostridiales bacterium]|nr:carbon-nitrogen hydrolase family protein [Clostridiales bacterium]
MRLGLLRATPDPWDPESNMELLERMAPEMAAKGVELLVTCECFLDGYCADRTNVKEKFSGELRRRFESMAQPDGCEAVRRAGELCMRLRMGMVLGLSTLENGLIYNTALLLGPDGKEIGRYHKTHLYEQDLNYEPGNGFPVFQTPWGPVGLLICADRRWPEAGRALRVGGAELILIPTYGMRHEANTCWMRTRAYENECYVAFCHPASALICNPAGEVEAQLLSNVPGILAHDVNLQKCGHEMLDLRRTDIY